MRNLKTCVALAVATLLFISCSARCKTEKSTEINEKPIVDLNNEGEVNSNQANDESPTPPLGQRVEAENINLTQYQIDNNGSSTYIKLTSSTGIAKFNFTLPSGRYDIDVRYLSESVGQNTYIMYIANNQIVAWLGKDRDDQWHMLSEQKWHAPRNIAIKNGDEIRIEALSDNGSLVIFDYIEFTESTKLSSTTKENLITIYPDEYDHAIKNPLKGFRPSTIYSGIESRFNKFSPDRQEHEYGTLIKNYFKWNELENSASDDVNKIKEVCDTKWHGVEEKNIKIIPRVYLAWPNRKSGWPADMTTGDFTSEQFKQRVITLITIK